MFDANNSIIWCLIALNKAIAAVYATAITSGFY